MSVQVVGIIKVKDNARKLYKACQDIPRKCVEIGEPSDSPNIERYDTDLTNADVGFIVEFMHPRSASDATGDTTNLLPGTLNALPEVKEIMRQTLLDILKLESGGNISKLKSGLKEVGAAVYESVLEQVVTKHVIDTGQYMASLRYDVKDS